METYIFCRMCRTETVLESVPMTELRERRRRILERNRQIRDR